MHTETLLLAGVAMSALHSAAMSFLIALSNRHEVVNAVYFWMLGGFCRADWPRVAVACLRAARQRAELALRAT